MLEVDGSIGEGGGQILRTAVAVSLILGEPVRVYNIRANRRNPGIRPQHLAAVKIMEKISGGRAEGLSIGSSEIVFHPGDVREGEYSIDIGTAGSVSLVLQTLLPPVLYHKKTLSVRIKGGTDVPWSPTVDYVRYVYLPSLRAPVEVEVRRRGFYPEGGGEVVVYVGKGELELRLGVEGTVKGTVVGDPSVGEWLKRKGVDVVMVERAKKGPSITVWDGSVGYSIVNEGEPPKVTAIRAYKHIHNERRNGCLVDRYLADQLAIYVFHFRHLSFTTPYLSSHLKTHLYILKHMAGVEYAVEKVEGCYTVSLSL